MSAKLNPTTENDNIPVATTNSPSEIDLLAFPTQTEVSFWIIVMVILGTMIAASIGPAPFFMWPTTLSILILPARALLAWPDKELAKQDHEATERLQASGILERLQSAITELANKAGYYEPIKLVISQNSDEARAFGSWRRHYILIGSAIADKLDADLQSKEHRIKAEALLVHEIAHIAHRDVQRVGYTRELLRSCFIVLSWWILFSSSWVYMSLIGMQGWFELDIHQVPGIDPLLATVVAPFLYLSPTEGAEVVAEMQETSLSLVFNFIIFAFMIIVLAGFIMWLFYWRRMLRLQEHYADYLVLKVTQDSVPLFQTMVRYKLSLTVAEQENFFFSFWNDWRERVSFCLDSRYHEQKWYGYLTRAYASLIQSLKKHPTRKERYEIIKKPALIYQNKISVTLSLALLILMIDLLLLSPLISYHSNYFPYITTLATFYLLSSWFLPAIVTQKPFRDEFVKMLGLIYGLLMGVAAVGFTLLMFLCWMWPERGSYLLNAIVLSNLRIAIVPSSLPVSEPIPFLFSVIPFYFAFQLLSLIVVLFLFFAYYHLHRKTVQENPSTALKIDWHQRHWLSVIALSIVVITLLLTPMSTLIFNEMDSLLTIEKLFGYSLGLVATAFLIIKSR